MEAGVWEAYSVLRESKRAELIILEGSRQHRPGVTQKGDYCDRVPGGPCYLGFSRRDPCGAKKWHFGVLPWENSGQSWGLHGTLLEAPPGGAQVLTETPGSPGSPGLP